jgi:hypothetical protein
MIHCDDGFSLATVLRPSAFTSRVDVSMTLLPMV